MPPDCSVGVGRRAWTDEFLSSLIRDRIFVRWIRIRKSFRRLPVRGIDGLRWIYSWTTAGRRFSSIRAAFGRTSDSTEPVLLVANTEECEVEILVVRELSHKDVDFVKGVGWRSGTAKGEVRCGTWNNVFGEGGMAACVKQFTWLYTLCPGGTRLFVVDLWGLPCMEGVFYLLHMDEYVKCECEENTWIKVFSKNPCDECGVHFWFGE